MYWGEVVFSRFSKDRRGNIAIITALTIIPLLGILGGGIDIVRSTTMSTQLRASIDSAALAAANLNNSADVETVVNEFIDSNLVQRPSFLSTLNVSVTDTVALNSKTVTISADGHIDTFFLGLFGIDTMPVSASSTATQSRTNVELALVMDISSSMRGDKLTNLKSAAEDFVDEIIDEDSEDYTSMSLIPFGGTVNIGSNMFSRFATNSGTTNPSPAAYEQDGNLADYSFLFSDGDYCIEHKNADFDDSYLPVNSRPQVPLFWKWWNNNPWCPDITSSVMLNSNDADALKTHINGMSLSDGTGMDIGALWGVKFLSPEFSGTLGGDFVDRPAAYTDEDTMKVLVVMTDGEITDQFRPVDYSKYSVHDKDITLNDPNGTDQTANTFFNSSSPGRTREQARRDDGKDQNQQELWDDGTLTQALSTHTAKPHFRRLCAEAKANGVIVYTIGFRINTSQDSDDLLLECASDASKYYLVESLDIQSAFDSIAASVNALRITG